MLLNGFDLCNNDTGNVGTLVEDLVLYLFGLRVLVRERRITVLEVTLVADKQPLARSVELLLQTIRPLHTAAECDRKQSHCGKHYLFHDYFHLISPTQPISAAKLAKINESARRAGP